MGGQRADPLGGDVVADDLTVDVLLANPPRDQLGILRAEVEDNDSFGLLGAGGRRRRGGRGRGGRRGALRVLP